VKTVEEMIIRVRRETRNATTGSTTAGASIDDAEFVDHLNDGQELCVEMISGVFSSLFESTKIYTIDISVADYEVLTFPPHLMLNTRICSVEYSYSGSDNDFVNIYPADIRERYSGSSYLRSLLGYIVSGNNIILTEVPNQNGSKVRVVYETQPPRLDVIKIPTVSTFTRTTTTIAVAYSLSDDHADVVSYWTVGDGINVLDNRDNSVVVRDGVISAIDTSAGTLTIDLDDATSPATYTAAVVDAIPIANVKLIEGGRTNFCELPDYCEKYINAYAVMEIFGRDGSKLATRAEEKFTRIESSLMKNYIQATKDWPAVPTTDY